MGLTRFDLSVTVHQQDRRRWSTDKGVRLYNGRTGFDSRFPRGAFSRARMHHKVVGNFGSEADVRSLYHSRFRFNETSDVGAYTHGRPAK